MSKPVILLTDVQLVVIGNGQVTGLFTAHVCLLVRFNQVGCKQFMQRLVLVLSS